MTMTDEQPTKERNHAEDNAKSWYEHICEWHAKHDDDTRDERIEEIEARMAELTTEIDELQAFMDDYQGDRRRAPFTLKRDALNEKDKERTTLENEKDDLEDRKLKEAIEEEIQESPLSVEIRYGWHAPGSDQKDCDAEYMILLSTGGPALRLTGTLGKYNEPDSARLEHQNWFTPWTEYHDVDEDILLWFARFFYFGDG